MTLGPFVNPISYEIDDISSDRFSRDNSWLVFLLAFCWEQELVDVPADSGWCAEHWGLGMCGPPPLLSNFAGCLPEILLWLHAGLIWTPNGPKPQSRDGCWARGALRSHRPQRRPSVAALAALGRRMGVPEVVFISDFSHYLFTNLCRRCGGGLPLLGQMMICSSCSCVSLFCVATCEHEPRFPWILLPSAAARRSWILVHHRRSRSSGAFEEFYQNPPSLQSHHSNR